MDFEFFKNELKERLTKEKYIHTLNTVKISTELAIFYGLDIEKIKLASLFHDYGKSFSDRQLLFYAEKFNLNIDRTRISQLHGPVAEIIIKKKYNIEDDEVLEAIRYHSIGYKNISDIGKILSIADLLEKNKQDKLVKKVKEYSRKNLNRAYLYFLKYKLKKSKIEKKAINQNTIDAKNAFRSYKYNHCGIKNEIEEIFKLLFLRINKNEEFINIEIKKIIFKYCNMEVNKIYKPINKKNKKVWYNPFTWFNFWKSRKNKQYNFLNLSNITKSIELCKKELLCNMINSLAFTNVYNETRKELSKSISNKFGKKMAEKMDLNVFGKNYDINEIIGIYSREINLDKYKDKSISIDNKIDLEHDLLKIFNEYKINLKINKIICEVKKDIENRKICIFDELNKIIEDSKLKK